MSRHLHPTEFQNQVAVMQWARLAMGRYPELDLLHHIPNGGSRHRIEAVNLKRAGVKSGIPDLCFPCARGGFHGAYWEMKAVGGKLSPAQIVCQARLRDEGYYVHTAWDAEDAIKTIENYLRLDDGKEK